MSADSWSSRCDVTWVYTAPAPVHSSSLTSLFLDAPQADLAGTRSLDIFYLASLEFVPDPNQCYAPWSPPGIWGFLVLVTAALL
jgi:hypothetical protein